MNHKNFSRAYYDLVDKSTQYHESHKSWAGFSQASYIKDIKTLVEKHNVKSLLDYGCGKGQQYIEKLEYTPGVFQTFNEYLNIDSAYKFDPCWKEFKNPPKENQKFDAVVLGVAHKEFSAINFELIKKEKSILYDVKGILVSQADGKL